MCADASIAIQTAFGRTANIGEIKVMCYNA